jgi:hypothetical protein
MPMQVLPSRIFIAVEGKKIKPLPGKLLACKKLCVERPEEGNPGSQDQA